ncbi:MAG: UbiA family prenyltransferase [Planctomycetes bacterium]|nr:UbiA family prenyltransferase [Planctomycetota bacterium]
MPSLLSILRLVRVGTVFSPAADVVASAALAGLPCDGLVVRAALASASLYAAGMVWNDIADRHVDARQRPERPLPSGQVGLGFAVALGTAMLALALLLSPCRLHHAGLAALVLAYDFLSKRLVVLAVLGMGLLRAGNLLTAASIGATASADHAGHVLVAAIGYGLYIVAVTVLGIAEDQQRPARSVVVLAQLVPPVVVAGVLLHVQGGWWPAPALAVLPLALFVRRVAIVRDWSRGAIRASMTWLLLGTMLYTAALTLAAGEAWLAAGIAAAIVPARWIARAIALT